MTRHAFGRVLFALGGPGDNSVCGTKKKSFQINCIHTTFLVSSDIEFQLKFLYKNVY